MQDIGTDMMQERVIEGGETVGMALLQGWGADPKAANQPERPAPVALRGAGLPQDMVNAVASLTRSGVRYVRGINLPVTGGVPFGV